MMGYELRKLFRLPALWVFLLLCLALNVLLIFSSDYGLSFFNETSKTTSILGQRIQDLLMIKPFITWGDFTVAGYLAATLALIAAMTVISGLISAIVGTLIQNTYVAALALLLLCAGGFALPFAFADLKLWAAYEISTFLPVTLWTTQNIWFTESGVSSILPWQETITAALGLLLFGCFTGLALRRFYRKDIA